MKIINGYLKNKNIATLTNKNLKPTISKIRKILFNWLSPIINKSNCLDCFAGSGILGIEAISNKASHVTFLEKNKILYKKILKNLKSLNVNKVKVLNVNTIKWLNKYYKKFNIVFIDPPFYKGMVNTTIKLLEKYKHLTTKAWIYIETEKTNLNLYNIPNNWLLKKKKIYKKK